MTDAQLENWIKGEEEKIDKDQTKSNEEWRKEQGLNPLFHFKPNVITEVKLLPVKPYEDKFKRMNFTIEVAGEKYDTPVTVKSPHYQKWIHKLRESVTKGEPISFKVVRTGTGLDTRYNFVEDQEVKPS